MLSLTRLESRDNPSRFWDGPETVFYGDLNADNFTEKITAAGVGGSARFTVDDGRTGEQLANIIAFEDTFRGGASVAVVDGALIVAPGPGGGARVETYRLGADGITVRNDLLPLGPDYRGGLQVAGGPVTYQPGKPGSPHIYLLSDAEFMAVDPQAFAVASRFPVGADWRFEPSGPWSNEADGRVSVTLDRGAVVDHYVAESESFDILTGIRV